MKSDLTISSKDKGERITTAIRFIFRDMLHREFMHRAFLEGRLSVEQLENFRRELKPDGGLSSYPHPWLMPEFLGVPNCVNGARSNYGNLSGKI